MYNKKTKTSSQSVSDFSTEIKRIVNDLTENGETVTESTLKWILYEELPEYQSQLMEKYCDEAVPYSAFFDYAVTLEKVAIRNKKKECFFAHSATEQPVSMWKTYKVGETHLDRSLVTNTHCMWCGILGHSMTEKGKTVCKVKIAGKPQTELGKSFENIKKLSGKAMLLSEFPALSMNEFSFAFLDSGAFPNIIMNDSCVHNNIHPSSSFVYTATGEKVPTKLEGNGVIETDGNSLEIEQTKILKKIPYNLLSVGVICDQLDATIVFNKDDVKILSDSPNLDHINILGSAAQSGGTYQMFFAPSQSNLATCMNGKEEEEGLEKKVEEEPEGDPEAELIPPKKQKPYHP